MLFDEPSLDHACIPVFPIPARWETNPAHLLRSHRCLRSPIGAWPSLCFTCLLPLL